jgi:hypothetical protein
MNSLKHDGRTSRPARLVAVALTWLTLLLGGAAVLAADGDSYGMDGNGGGPAYMVTITNLTYNQIISPPVVVVHDDRFRLFQPGQPASDELTALAEDGMTGPLAGLLAVSPGVFDYAVAGGGIPPASSVSVMVRARGNAKLLSLAGMLVSTNDAFAGLDSAPIAAWSIDTPAYDAGSEANTESCEHIPGPPCGSPGMRVTDGAEGFVHVHRGIHGVGSLDESMKDWRNPTARVTIKKM